MDEVPSRSPVGTGSLVLHTLRCIGYVDTARMAAAAGMPEAVVESDLIDLAASGYVTYTRGDFGGWGLTDAGRVLDSAQIAAELEMAGAGAAIAQAYQRFLTLNPEMLDLCTAWQIRSAHGVMAPNDHTDPGYDARILDRIANLDARVQPICTQLSEALPRFQRYGLRLADALTRARAGELEYVATSTSSYHTVWFQLHEDLLVTLGIPRF
ncbi:hypothetical protein KO481_11925 [Nocardia sp. NEAU-G5]|uniref:Transcriptional regulator n=1 Tax=Nocardia albiluteola TaxID=2842303 RepID=A0ABS6AYE0_9NOCA|nr:hypothetical protein [Nocardia albiluteola]MBU3062231.1 hypothetical protein [Nocardia albiluteola]